MQIIDEVNRVLPGDRQISWFGNRLVWGRVARLHRLHYPESRLFRKMYFWYGVSSVAAIGAMATVVRFT